MPRSCYDVLEIAQGETDENVVKRAYRRLALKHHPDKGGDPEKFREICEAYKTLLMNNEVEDEDWENFDPVSFFKEHFAQNDVFMMVQDYGLFDGILDGNNLMGTLFSNLGNIMTDGDKIFHLATSLMGDDNSIFNTLKSTHDFAKDMGSRIKDVSMNINAKLKDVYEGRVVRVRVKRRRFVNGEMVDDAKKFAITLQYEKFKIPHEGHQIVEMSTACGDIIFNIHIKDSPNVTRFAQDNVFVEAVVCDDDMTLCIPWANGLVVCLADWKKDIAKLMLLSGYGFIKGDNGERGDMYIHCIYGNESIKDDDTTGELIELDKSVKEVVVPVLVQFKNLIQ